MDRDKVLEIIKERIVYLDYEPGKQLREKELREEFDIGRTPLREIFIKLESEGLITTVPHSGTYVSTVSFHELRDLFEVRSYLISLAGKLAARRINEGELEEMRQHLKEMEGVEKPKKLMKMDSQAHEMVNRATKNEVLAESLKKLREQSVRIWVFPRTKKFMNSFKVEFAELIKALEEGDEERSGKILASHMEDFIDEIKEQFISESHVEYEV
ncbi:GntR family transcriptional regulator [Candidatus Bipolaricaulota bacterium]|nr:GntR family transcriptional regulator [Candidatus Bipolaricaulota bacterium]